MAPLQKLSGNFTGQDVYNLINALVDQANGTASGLTTEIANRGASETTINGNVTGEGNIRSAADGALQTSINGEASTRATVDGQLLTLANGKANSADLTNESATRLAADQGLQTSLNGEASTRLQVDNQLLALAGTLAAKADLTTESATRLAADQGLQTSINTEASTRTTVDGQLLTLAASKADGTALTNESATRLAADQGLQTSINSEAALRLQVDNQLLALVGQQLTTANLAPYATSAVVAALSSRVDGKADNTALTALAQTIGTMPTADAFAALRGLVNAAASTTQVQAVRDLVTAVVQSRPGDAPDLFTGALAGGPANGALGLIAGVQAVGPQGRVWRLTGPGIVAGRRFEPLEPGRVYRDGFAVQRSGDPVDPAGDAVAFGVAYYDANLTFLSSVAYQTLNTLLVANGFTTGSFTVAAVGGNTATFQAPPGAAYRRPFVQVYGYGHVTDVIRVSSADITDATTYSPDLTAYTAALNALTAANLPARMTAVEGQLTAPSSLGFASRASATAATIPATVGFLRVVGYAAAGDGGQLDFRRLLAGETPIAPLSFASKDGAVWQPIRASLGNVVQLGADPTGNADSLFAFQGTSTALRWTVPPGTYKLSADFVDYTRAFDLSPGVTFTGAGRLYADVRRSYLPVTARTLLPEVIAKMRAGTAVAVGCFGDSLTAGFEGDGQGSWAYQGNGYSGAPRSSITYPQALQNALRSVYANNAAGGSNVQAVNFGYPGDTAYAMLRRWYDYAATDVSVIMIGTNDGIQAVPVATYEKNLRQFIERRLDLRSAVVIVLPPTAPGLVQNAGIHAMRAAAAALAEEYALPVVDARDQLAPLGFNAYVSLTDVHLSTPGYNLLGWDMGALFAPTGQRGARHLAPGVRITAGDMPGDGTGDASGSAVMVNPFPFSRDSYAVEVLPGYTFSLPVYVDRDCAPVLETVLPDTSGGHDFTYQRIGQNAIVCNFDSPVLANVYRHGWPLPVVSKGWRLLQFKATGGAPAYMDAVSGIDPDAASFSADGVFRASPLAGQRRPPTGSGLYAWSAREFRALPWVQRICAKVTLDATVECGLAIEGGPDASEGGASAQVQVIRSGPNLVIRVLGTADTVVTGVFPVGASWSGDLEVYIDSYNVAGAVLHAYVNGVESASRGSLPFVGGYVGLVSFAPGVLECPMLQVQEGLFCGTAAIPYL